MEEEKFVLSILVTREQKLVIEALFNHNNWDFVESNPATNLDDSQPSDTGHQGQCDYNQETAPTCDNGDD